ncbi:hypothetical protein FOA52_007443 [Chlamydomonas sp. UWO 241]|nr:hypothetical protein FOA52_007443 [Chlamydomonas sp. UWO 241]
MWPQLMKVPGANQCMYRGKLHGSVVAVKCLETSDVLALKWAHNELRVLVRVIEGCHFVCKVLGITVKANQLCIIMHMYAKSLADYIKEQPGGRLSAANAVFVGRDIVQALAELHAAGVVLMDLKPNNILMTESNVAVLADLGISKVLESATSAQQTQMHGTLSFMSPEQYNPDVLTVSTKADIWAFGCTYIHMVTGQPPMKGLNVGQMCNRINVQCKAPKIPVAELPRRLTAVLQRCLNFDPKSRLSATELVQALETVFADGMKAVPGELSVAAKKGDSEEVHSLLSRAADVNEVDEVSGTVLGRGEIE